MGALKHVRGAFTLPFRLLGFAGKVVLRGWLLNQRTGARFASRRERRAWLGACNRGVLLDGKSARLSETESYQNILVIARVGAGKGVYYVIPNILDCIGRKVSLVVNDPKGEAFARTSAAMARAGFRVILLDPENPAQSNRFNPLLECRDAIEIEQVAEIIVRAGNANDDSFWIKGGIRFVSVFLKALRNEAKATGQAVLTLAHLLQVFSAFGSDGRALDAFMARACIDPDDPQDRSLWLEWKRALTGNRDGVQSFVLTAITALGPVSNRNLAWITAESDFSLADLRRQKTIIYIVTPPQHAGYYAFWSSLIMRSVFTAAMRQLPAKGDLSIHIYYDEFGHGTIPEFLATINTIRAYKVSVSAVLQSIAQLSTRYGRDGAQALLGGFNTLVTYAGSDPETCLFFEKACGRVRERQTKDLAAWNPQDTYREFNLLNAGEVRGLGNGETLIVMSNRPPVRLPVTPYFKHGSFRRRASKGAVKLPVRPVTHALPRLFL